MAWAVEKADRGVAGRPKLLQIFVIPFCFGCDVAMTMAESIQNQQIANVYVQLIDLSEPGAMKPETVFAVPTYLLDGKIVSLGNPEEPWLVDRIMRANEE